MVVRPVDWDLGAYEQTHDVDVTEIRCRRHCRPAVGARHRTQLHDVVGVPVNQASHLFRVALSAGFDQLLRRFLHLVSLQGLGQQVAAFVHRLGRGNHHFQLNATQFSW